MKHKNKINFKISTLLLLCSGAMLLYTSCKVEPLDDPNNPGESTITQNASLGEIQNLVTGAESGMRDAMSFYWDDVGVIGREFYRFSTSDPRFTSDLLGKGNAILDNNTFYITNPFAARYRVVKNTNILIDALTNTKAAITDAQRKAGIAYAKTIKAHELLMVLNLENANGVRVDVSNPDNPGPFLSKDESLNAILTLLNEANTDLAGNAAKLPFTSNIYSSNAADFSKFNRALAARVLVYKGDWSGALAALNGSFFNLNGDLKDGVYYLYSTAGGDQLNPLFYPLNSSGETRVAQPSFVTDAEAGDTRKDKVVLRTAPTFQDGLTSSYDFFVYKTNTDKIPIIRNAELLLIYAEALINQGGAADLANAKIALDKIRAAASLPPYAGALTKAAMLDEMLKQRRYELYGEGHRWIDIRRYNRLSTLPIDRTGDDIWVEFPRPATEK